jgi:hypothetical protein
METLVSHLLVGENASDNVILRYANATSNGLACDLIVAGNHPDR